MVKRWGTTLGGAALLTALFQELGNVLCTDRQLTLDTPARGDVVAGGDIGASSDLPAAWVVASLTGLLPLPGTQEEKEQIALAALLSVHHPCVVARHPGFWIKMCKSLELDPSEVLFKHQEALIDLVNEQIVDNTDACGEIVKTVVKVNPGSLLPFILANLRSVLSNKELLNKDVNDFQTYLTPEGELYDTSVIESNNVDNTNIKRESKAYSYKEQMEELALRIGRGEA